MTQSDLGLHCLTRPFCQATSVPNFRTFTVNIFSCKTGLNALKTLGNGENGLFLCELCICTFVCTCGHTALANEVRMFRL